MKDQQRIAYNSPVTTPFGMLNRRFAKQIRVGKLFLGTVLTCNLFGGDPSWHASISVLNRRYQPQPIENVPDAAQQIITEQLVEMLEGVGVEAQSQAYQSASALHLTRPLTPEEMAGISQ